MSHEISRAASAIFSPRSCNALGRITTGFRLDISAEHRGATGISPSWLSTAVAYLDRVNISVAGQAIAKDEKSDDLQQRYSRADTAHRLPPRYGSEISLHAPSEIPKPKSALHRRNDCPRTCELRRGLLRELVGAPNEQKQATGHASSRSRTQFHQASRLPAASNPSGNSGIISSLISSDWP